MLDSNRPALVLAPMDGVTDAPMRALQGATGAFTYAVTEFIRVSQEPLPQRVFRRDVPELANGAKTPTGMPVQVQILGGHPERMAISAARACQAGGTAIDINFGCPAPTVNRNDGGASLLQHPCRIREIVQAVRQAVPLSIPVSAKLRLGWDNTEAIHENAAMAAEGGASWLTIHARTRTQGYQPPVYWKPIGQVQKALGIPIIANGDIWSLDDFKRCQDHTGSIHFMLGRCALADPSLPYKIANELGTRVGSEPQTDWLALFEAFGYWNRLYHPESTHAPLARLKQWASLAAKFGDFPWWDELKLCRTSGEFLKGLEEQPARPLILSQTG